MLKVTNIQKPKMNRKYTKILLALLATLTVSQAASTARPFTLSERKAFCASRSGLKAGDFVNAIPRNENCAHDCITKQGTLMSFYSHTTSPCGNSGSGYRCVMGKCVSPDEPTPDYSDLLTTEIRILSARVPDLDPAPTQGESDTFALLEIQSGGEPNYKNGDIACHTYIVQDNANPRWNFLCKPLPLRPTAVLNFMLVDSDKPIVEPDYIGNGTETVEYLLKQGRVKIPLLRDLNSNRYERDYYVEVEVKGKKYDPTNMNIE